MCVLDRFDLPSPLKYGQLFGDLHKPRLRRPGMGDKSSLTKEFGPAEIQEIEKTLFGEKQPTDSPDEKFSFSDCFQDAPDFPKRELLPFVSFEERVAVIYALYSIYNAQCLEPCSCVHFPVDLLPSFVDFLPKLMENAVLDAVYMIQELFRKDAFVFDVIRRPPGFLSLPLEKSASEASALRELSFHLKTSLQVGALFLL